MAYDHSVILTILSLEEAKMRLKSEDMKGFLEQFRTKATNSGLNNQCGNTLVHRHTDVKPGFRLFDFKQTLQPFPLSDEAEDLYGVKIRPKSFAWRQGSLMPYEFEIGPPDEIATDFLADIVVLLKTFKLEGVLGLRRYSLSDEEELEITENGGTSVKVPWKHAIHKDDEDFTETFWAFPDGTSPSGGPKMYKCHCRNTGSKDRPNHNHINS